jgi:UDP-N-acetylglucosamine 4,6-dehydratase
VDARELNYDQYFEEGDQEESTLEDYHSHNTERLDVDQVVDLLNSMPAFQALLRAD